MAYSDNPEVASSYSFQIYDRTRLSYKILMLMVNLGYIEWWDMNKIISICVTMFNVAKVLMLSIFIIIIIDFENGISPLL
jgi:hypothetical protein